MTYEVGINVELHGTQKIVICVNCKFLVYS